MTAQFLAKWLTIHKSILVCSAVDSGGAGDARSPLEFGGSAKRDRQSITTSTPGFEKLSTALVWSIPGL
jgi:hypothetical protein